MLSLPFEVPKAMRKERCGVRVSVYLSVSQTSAGWVVLKPEEQYSVSTIYPIVIPMFAWARKYKFY